MNRTRVFLFGELMNEPTRVLAFWLATPTD
jgi:hypothetical protein